MNICRTETVKDTSNYFEETIKKSEVMRITIMNDTSVDLHHGCSRVMDVLESKLASRGALIAAKVPRSYRWWRNPKLVKRIASSDAVIINGEGTFHHGAIGARNLLGVLEHKDTANIPVHLVNTLFQDNPAEWKSLLNGLCTISPRDSFSAQELSNVLDREITHLLDLSLCDGRINTGAERVVDLIVGDSVDQVVTQHLIDFSNAAQAMFMPSLSRLLNMVGKKGITAVIRSVKCALHEQTVRQSVPNLYLAPNTGGYLQELSKAQLHVTGRFHGVCFSILTQTPFLAITSNSWKIEALIADLNLDPERIVSPENLTQALDSRDWSYSTEEKCNIAVGLHKAKQASDALFDRIMEVT